MGKTLEEFVVEQTTPSEEVRDEFAGLMDLIVAACRRISSVVRRAGLSGVQGVTGAVNVQGEEVKHLDEFAHSVFLEVMQSSTLVRHIASEEMPGVVSYLGVEPERRYSLMVDPLDGSSNADINGIVGTIFSVHRLASSRSPEVDHEILIQGSKQLAAGYVMYGPSTILVYTSGSGVNGFTLDDECGEFILSHEKMRIPEKGKSYAINHGNRAYWTPATQKFISEVSQPDGSDGRPCPQRWVGSLVADFHRILLEGGSYLYPADQKRPEGKLRLLYECAPLGMLAEDAGGRAITGLERVLDLQPTKLHQRVPLIIGSREHVDLAEKYAREEAAEGPS